MKTINISFENQCLSKQDTKELMVGFLDYMINHHKIQYLSDWEKNHSITSSTSLSKIKVLEKKKEELTEAIENLSSDEFDLNISLLNTSENSANFNEKVIEYSENHY